MLKKYSLICFSVFSTIFTSQCASAPGQAGLYTFEKLFKNHVLKIEKEDLTKDEYEKVKKKNNKLFGSEEQYFKYYLFSVGSSDEPMYNDDWKFFSSSNRSVVLENSNYCGYLYKFCASTPGSGNLAAHFLRVPKGGQIKEIITRRNPDMLEVVDEKLICLSDQVDTEPLHGSLILDVEKLQPNFSSTRERYNKILLKYWKDNRGYESKYRDEYEKVCNEHNKYKQTRQFFKQRSAHAQVEVGLEELTSTVIYIASKRVFKTKS